MKTPLNKEYGTWNSPISPQIAGDLIELSEPIWTARGDLAWRERQSNQSRIQILRAGASSFHSIPFPENIGGGILYGGGSFTSSGDDLYLIQSRSARIYRSRSGEQQPELLVDLPGRAATPRISPDQTRLTFIHSHLDRDSIQNLNLGAPDQPRELASGADFYNYIRWSPNGENIAWISWDHPDMPWDNSRLEIADFSLNGAIEKTQTIVGGDGCSIIQPEFSPDGRLLAYVSDISGWWQIYLYELDSGQHRQLTHFPAEHGLPPWLQDQCFYDFSPDGKRIFFIRNHLAAASLWEIEIKSGNETHIQLDENYTWLEDLAVSPHDGRLAMIASSWDTPQRVIIANQNGSTKTIQKSETAPLPRKLFSKPESIEWQDKGGETIHGLFYSPHHPEYRNDGQPPLLCIIHSGPTRQKWIDFHPKTQYFTSRGFAVLEVNYRGSTGYGRAYRDALKGQWGVTDVADIISGARNITRQGLASKEKMALYGSSAGGYTVLQVLVHFPGVFQAAVSLYGIANQLTLMENPPKFERFYSEWLIGPYPEAVDLYKERSPLFSADRIQDPVAVFQGGEDPIVPQNQAEQMIRELEKNQIPHLYQLYPEESHGFKKSENVQDCYQQIDKFLREYLISS
jgi:dipeptidyl aminopeptidase/acylaminoacyl peptidase